MSTSPKKESARLTQVQFVKLFQYLTEYTGAKTTISVLTEKANEALNFAVSQDAVTRCLNEFNLRSKLVASHQATSGLLLRVEELEKKVEKLEQLNESSPLFKNQIITPV